MEKRHCRACGAEILEGNTYCAFCGSEDIGVRPQTVNNVQNTAAQPQSINKPSIALRVVGVIVLVAMLVFMVYEFTG